MERQIFENEEKIKKRDMILLLSRQRNNTRKEKESMIKVNTSQVLFSMNLFFLNYVHDIPIFEKGYLCLQKRRKYRNILLSRKYQEV